MTPTKIEALEALQTVEIARILRDMRSPLSVEAANRIASQAATIRQMREVLELAKPHIIAATADRISGADKSLRAIDAVLNGGAK